VPTLSTLAMPQDFSGQNLRGRSFKGQNLAGANFSYADIRSADFTEANLRSANFSHAQAGLQRRWAIFLIFVSWFLSGASGFFSAFAGCLAAFINVQIHAQKFDGTGDLIAGVSSLLVLAAFFIIVIHRGVNSIILGSVAVSVPTAIAGVIAVVTSVNVAVSGALPLGLAGILFASSLAAVALIISAILVGTTAVVIIIIIITSAAVAVTFSINLTVAGITLKDFSFFFAVAFSITEGMAFAILNTYICKSALNGNPRYTRLNKFAVTFTATKGTNFRNANLTESDFTQSILKNTDFKNAILLRARFYKVKKLEYACAGETYLQKEQLRQVLVTGQGQDKNFDRTDLRGVNFQSANLQDASFIGADLSYASLQDANLSRAKLKQTQLDETDFTGATLTGAYIEDWGITSNTKFDGVSCEYVYMRLPTKENPDPCRKPDNRQEVFEDGGFGDFIKPIVDTLDLYHNQGVDPRAIAIAFKQLAENNPEAELEIVAMEKRGRDKFLLRANTAATADKSELSQEYFDTYNYLKALPERDIQLLIAEKDNRIRSLENMVVTALQRPNFYAGTYNNQGDTMSDKSSNIKFGNVGGDIGAFAGGDIQGVAGKDITGAVGGDISGTVTTTIGQLQESNAPEAAKLADLLKQLQTAIESDKNLSEDDKAEALEQVKALAEAGQSPEEGAMQKTAKTAIRVLKGIITDLPAVATIVEASQKLLPAIAQIFSLSI
jgi:uncharacterized protein YjbI with pentapeptide repeats